MVSLVNLIFGRHAQPSEPKELQLIFHPGRPPPTSARRPRPSCCRPHLPHAHHHLPLSPRPPPRRCCTPRQSWPPTPHPIHRLRPQQAQQCCTVPTPPPTRHLCPPPPRQRPLSTQDHPPRQEMWTRSASTSAWSTLRAPMSQLAGQLSPPLYKREMAFSDKSAIMTKFWRQNWRPSELNFFALGTYIGNFFQTVQRKLCDFPLGSFSY